MTQISDLTAITALDFDEEFVVAQPDSTTRKITAANLLAALAPRLPGYELDYAQITSPVTISATTAATAGVCITGSAVTYDGSTRICIESFSPYVDTAATSLATCEIVLYDFSGAVTTELGSLAWYGRGDGTRTRIGVHYARRFLTPSAAAHTYSIRAWRSVANGIFAAGPGGASAFLPAYMRITRA